METLRPTDADEYARRFRQAIIDGTMRGLSLPGGDRSEILHEELDRAREEIERLRADAARLDWLESQEECEVGRMGTSVTYWCVIGEMVGGSGTGPTLRAAIDQARAGTAA